MIKRYIAFLLLTIFLTVFSGCTKEESYVELSWKNPPAADDSSSIKSGSGKFIGLADNNFIEIQINGSLKDNPFMVFMMNKEIKNSYLKSGIKTGDPVTFEYKTNEYGQNVLQKLVKS